MKLFGFETVISRFLTLARGRSILRMLIDLVASQKPNMSDSFDKNKTKNSGGG
jgi:hypothetical protein